MRLSDRTVDAAEAIVALLQENPPAQLGLRSGLIPEDSSHGGPRAPRIHGKNLIRHHEKQDWRFLRHVSLSLEYMLTGNSCHRHVVDSCSSFSSHDSSLLPLRSASPLFLNLERFVIVNECDEDLWLAQDGSTERLSLRAGHRTFYSWKYPRDNSHDHVWNFFLLL